MNRDKHSGSFAKIHADARTQCPTSAEKDYGLHIGKVDLISNTHIAMGEIAAFFGETSTVWDQDDVDEFDRIATLQNTLGNAQQIDSYVSGNAPGNQGHFHIIPRTP